MKNKIQKGFMASLLGTVIVMLRLQNEGLHTKPLVFLNSTAEIRQFSYI